MHGGLGVVPKDDTCTHNADDFAPFLQTRSTKFIGSASSPLYHVPVRTTPTLVEWTVITVAGVDKLMAEQDVSVRPSTNVAGQGHAMNLSLVSIHGFTVQ